MKLKKSKSLLLQFLLINQIFVSFFCRTIQVKSMENNNIPNQEYLRADQKEGSYILGPGDKLKLEINEFTKELNTIFDIDGRGFAFLKRLGVISFTFLSVL